MIRLTGDNPYRRSPSDEPPKGGGSVDSAGDTMNMFAAALLMIDENLHVVRRNKKAGAYLTGPDADSFLKLLTNGAAGQAQDLRKRIRETVIEGLRNVFLLQPDTPQATICSITPMHEPDGLHALVALMPLMGGSDQVVPHLRQIYHLSNAEAEIAASAASGMDVVQMAQSRQVSIHTLRAQIAAVKAKMGLSRMTEIAVTVGRIEAAIAWL